MNPVLKSSSPSDFWGRRWNLIVHGVLKRGVYKPVRKHFTKLIAAIAVFLASGLFHEWVLAVIFYKSNNFPYCYGKNILFFTWNGLIIVGEHIFGNARVFQWISKTFPRFMVSLLVVLIALPIAHWFTGDYTESTFFECVQLGFFIIKRI